jgi:tRNA uridine 5-carboxymethylaminomethyl modification enzyme
MSLKGAQGALLAGPGLDDPVQAEQVDIQAKYAGYVDRQREEIERQKAQADQLIPDDFDYASVAGLSTEVRQRLETSRPATVGQAARISGVTPAAVSLLLVHLKRHARGRQAA